MVNRTMKCDKNACFVDETGSSVRKWQGELIEGIEYKSTKQRKLATRMFRTDRILSEYGTLKLCSKVIDNTKT